MSGGIVGRVHSITAWSNTNPGRSCYQSVITVISSVTATVCTAGTAALRPSATAMHLRPPRAWQPHSCWFWTAQRPHQVPPAEPHAPALHKSAQLSEVALKNKRCSWPLSGSMTCGDACTLAIRMWAMLDLMSAGSLGFCLLCIMLIWANRHH